MISFSSHAKALRMLVPALASVALVVMWPQWQNELQGQSYGNNAKAQISANGGSPETDFQTLPSFKSAPVTLPLRITCIDALTLAVIDNCTVNVALSPPSFSGSGNGGHDHDDPNRPVGSITPSSGKTPLDVLYTGPQVSGDVTGTITGTDPNLNPLTATQFTMHVGVNGLGQLNGIPSVIALTGQNPNHPLNHFGLGTLLSNLQGVAADYHNAYPMAQPLALNDMSLPTGGLFDFCLVENGYTCPKPGAPFPWQPPHSLHRFGTSADIGSGAPYSFQTNIPFNNRLRLLYIIRMHHLKTINEDPCFVTINSTHCNHWHLEQQ